MGTYRTLDMNACAIPDPGYFAVSINTEKTGSVAQEMCSKGTADMRLTNYSPRLNRATYTAVGGVHVNDTVARSFVGKCSSCPQGEYQHEQGQTQCTICNGQSAREPAADDGYWGTYNNCGNVSGAHDCGPNGIKVNTAGTHCLFKSHGTATHGAVADAGW